METKFELNPKEIKAAEKFIKKLPKEYRDVSKHITFSFGNGIGTGVKISVGDNAHEYIEKDITDYSLW